MWSNQIWQSDFQWWMKKVQHPAQEPQFPTQAVSAITTIQVLTTGPESQWIYTANNRSSSGWSFHKKRNDSQLTRCHHHLGPHYRPNWQDLIRLNNLYAEYISYPLSRLSWWPDDIFSYIISTILQIHSPPLISSMRWFSDALASLDFKLSVSERFTVFQLAHLLFFQSYF